MKILRINPKDTYQIRQQILRPTKKLEDCVFASDNEDQTFHLGAFFEGQLVSVASYYFERSPKIDTPYQYRLRGMATLEEHRGKGFSTELLKMGFPIVKQNLCSLIWCNARVEAVGFYEKAGFSIRGEEFDIPDIGPHFLMVKDLDS